MFRKVLGLVAFVPLLATSAGCGGYSEERSQELCSQEAFAKEACMSDEAFDQCVDCYMECGNKCEAQAECPEVYACEE